MDKKGSILDVFVWMVLAFIITLFLAGLVYFFGILTDSLVNIEGTVGANNLSDVAQDTFGKVNAGLPGMGLVGASLLFGLMISILVSNFLIRAHPAWGFVYICIAVLAIIMAVPISNTYEILYNDQIFGDQLSTNFRMSSFVLLNLPIFAAVISILGGIFLFINITRDSQLGGSPI